MNASVIKIRLFITSKLCSTSIKYKYIGLIIGIHISPFAYSYCIKGAFISPLIHYIANNDTNLNNATTNENTNAASNKNLIMVHFPVLPIPPAPRAVSVNCVTSNNFNAPTGTRIPCTNLSPFWIKYASSLVLCSIALISPL